jgi:uncharacterized protein involved in exopolysaccharide biosynthesis
LSDLPVKTSAPREEMYAPEGLVFDPLDEESLREAHERLAERVRLLWNKRRFLIRATVWGLIVATLVGFLIPKRYKSTAGLMPPDQPMGAGVSALAALSSQFSGGLAGLAGNGLGVKTTGAMFVGILRSDTVRDDVIREFNLQRVYGTRYVEDTRKKLTEHTEIAEEPKSGIITISVTDRDSRRAAAMAQEYLHELNWVVTHLSTSAAHRERVFLDQRLEEVKSNLEDAEKQFSQFASQKGAIDIPAQGKAMVTAAATLQGEVIAAEAELEAFRQIYTDNNARVRSLEAKVDGLRGSLEKLAGKGANEKSAADRIYPSLRELPMLGVTYADLLRRTKVQEAVFETLTKEDELTKVQEAKEIPSVKVLDPPEVPEKRSFPPRLLIMSLGTMLALVGGVAWILASAAWEATEPSDPRKAVAMEVWTNLRASWQVSLNNGSWLGRPAGWLKVKFGAPRDDGTTEATREEAERNKR